MRDLPGEVCGEVLRAARRGAIRRSRGRVEVLRRRFYYALSRLPSITDGPRQETGLQEYRVRARAAAVLRR